MKLFVDDIRNPEYIYEEDDWTVARSYEEAVQILSNGDCTAISLDHDLGENVPTGYDLAKWLTKTNSWPVDVKIHSQNPVGANNILREYEFWLKHKDEIKNISGNDSWEL